MMKWARRAVVGALAIAMLALSGCGAHERAAPGVGTAASSARDGAEQRPAVDQGTAKPAWTQSPADPPPADGPLAASSAKPADGGTLSGADHGGVDGAEPEPSEQAGAPPMCQVHRQCPGGFCREGRCACGVDSVWCHGRCEISVINKAHCGACDRRCRPEQGCFASGCGACTGPAWLLCGGLCVHGSTDRNHCGGCGARCPRPKRCIGGTCVEAIREPVR
jgi:hypothetical protein